jgi:hypothetical protein
MLVLWLLIWISSSVGAATVASNRGASGCLWFGLGFLLGPFGLALAFVAGSDAKCQACLESVHPQATKCPHCQTVLSRPDHRATCASCGKKISPSAAECPFCQKQLRDEAAEVDLGNIICSKCDASNDARRRLCEKCLEPLGLVDDPVRADELSHQIIRLADLHAKGCLSDDEFRQAKRKLLY